MKRHFLQGLLLFAMSASLQAQLPLDPGPSAQLLPEYRLRRVGSINGRTSAGLGLSESGLVVGASQYTGSPSTGIGIPAEAFADRGFAWSFGRGLFSLGGVEDCASIFCQSRAYDVANDGLVVGWASDGNKQPMVFSPRAEPAQGLLLGLNLLPNFPGGEYGELWASNEAREFVGVGSAPTQLRPLRWRLEAGEWKATDLGSLDALGLGWGNAYDINERGEIVGSSNTDNGWPAAFIWLPKPAYGLPKGMHQITPPIEAGFGASARAINDLGEVVGVRSHYGIPSQPWIWLPEANYGLSAGFNDLPLIPSGDEDFPLAGVEPTDINNLGHVVGTAALTFVPELDRRGVIRSPGGPWTILDTRIPNNSGWVIRNAFRGGSINDAGQISGDAVHSSLLDINGTALQEAFRLDPIPGSAPGY